MKRLLFLTIAVIFFMTDSIAGKEAPDFKFRHYTTETGLPSNCIRDIVQDGEGFIWFGTDGGLLRFDGKDNTVFYPENGAEDMNPYLCAMSLCMAGDDLIVGTTSGIYRFDRRSERLRILDIKYPPGMTGLDGTEIRSMECDSDGCLWISTKGRGIYQVGPDMTVKARHEFPELDDYVATLYCDSHNNVWGVSASKEGGVYRFDRHVGAFRKFALKENGKTMIYPSLAIFENSNGDYYLGTRKHGLIQFDSHTGNVVKECSEGWHDAFLHIHSITEFTPTKLLVGSDRGLVLYDIPTDSHISYGHDELDRRSLTDQFVYPILKDREGGVWVGTFYGGVNYAAPDTKKIKSFTHSRFRNSVSGNVVSSICEDESGNLWIGSDDGGVCRYTPSTGMFRRYPLRSIDSHDNVHALSACGNEVWVGTYSTGAGVLDAATGKWRYIALEGVGTSYNCYAILKDGKGEVWMASNTSLNRYDKERNVFVSLRDLDSWIVDICEDTEGRIWVATQGKGAFLYDPSDGAWTNYDNTKLNGKLPHSYVNQLTVTPQGEIYVATMNGIGRFDEKRNCFESIDIGLPSKNIQSLEKIGESLWVAASAGLIRWRLGGKTERYIGSDGMVSNEFTSGTMLYASDGRMYVGSVNGFCSFSPSDVKLNACVPPVRFTALEVVNRKITVGDELLPESLNSIGRLVLGHEDHTFSIGFASLSYANPECNSFRYKLEGFDKGWIDPGKESRATYSNLPPGNYTLRVKASNNDGIWNEEGATLRIEILPVWYASWWMKCLYLVAIIAMFVSGLRYERHRREAEHKEELERVSSNKEKEVYRTKLKFFTIVAHEIRTPVSLIIGPLEKVMESSGDFPASVMEDLDMIGSNAKRLLSLVNQMLDFKKVEESAMPTVFRHTSLVPVIESVVQRFRPSVEHGGAVISTFYPEEEVMADICRESFTKLVSNLLNNARKFTKDRIILRCEADVVKSEVRIIVEDNGIGIKRENLHKIFTPFYQIIDSVNDSRGGTGLGLSIVKNVAESHGGTVGVESEPGKGSRFIVTLPLRQENVIPEESAMALPEEGNEREDVASRKDSRPVMLLADDNAEMLGYISRNMACGYDVATAENGKEALGILRERSVDLIVCDWMMPEMDGLSLLHEVRNSNDFSHIPFIMLTAKTDTYSKVESMRAGADAYVEKPFSMAFLEARIGNLLDIRRMLRERFASSPLEPVAMLAQTPSENEFLSRMTALIEDNFSNPDLNVDFLADKLGISRTGLYAKIKTLADVRPNELIKITRLKKAAELITEGKHNINEICYMTGFSSPSYFSKCFFKQFGILPGQFAEKSKA